MASRKITEFIKPGPGGPPQLPLREPSKKPVGRPRKRPLDHDNLYEVPFCSPLGEDEGKKIGSIVGSAYAQ